jgi:hypothetical protein
MAKPLMLLAVVVGLVLADGAGRLAAEEGGGGLLRDVPGLEGTLDRPAGEILAEGQGGTLTGDAVAAYVEALEFSLGEIGRPAALDDATRREIGQRFAQSFAGLPLDEQRFLANAHEIWSRYRRDWPGLGRAAQRDFMLVVLTFAFGPQAAGQALGLE